MEESISVYLLHQHTDLTLRQIFNLEPIISQRQIRSIRLPFQLRKFRVKMPILHACLFYIIGVQKNLTQKGSSEFRDKCLLAISSYYVSKKMHFELYEYGYMCSKILTLPLQKIIHIIYFMVYARLASKPYISNLIVQGCQKKKVFRRETIKSQNQESIMSQSIGDSRHMTMFMESNQLQIQVFRKDLKKVLSSQGEIKKSGKRNQNKRYFNLKKLYPDEENTNEQYDNTDNTPILKQQTSKVVNIPSKVRAFDNSSVMLRLRNSSSGGFGHNSVRKLHMRRQKFNEDFNCMKKYDMVRRGEPSEQKGTEWSTSKFIGDQTKKNEKTQFRHQKHPYQYFRQMASSIKSKNKQLDVIRSECVTRGVKRFNPRDYDWSRQQKTTDLISPNEAVPQIQKQSQKMVIENKSDENILKLIKKESSKLSADQPQKVASTGPITRKTNSSNQQQKLMLFDKKKNNKFKLQKYKQQYKQFLKTQMFERERIIF